jgi:S-adenosyl-L-methionine hydrolase (adenosine-forming)
MPITRDDVAAIKRIALVTDFGEGLYVGQMRAWLDALQPGLPVIDLVHDLPACRPDLAAYLLPALVRDMPADTLYLAVVDPGVGGDRAGLIVRADGAWFIGPDNGLFAQIIHRAAAISIWSIGWRPTEMSPSFHGRDWFVPVTDRLCRGRDLELEAQPRNGVLGADWPLEQALVLYVDRFGNLISGLNAPATGTEWQLIIGSTCLPRARTFCDVPPGAAFWYENAFGLVEIAVNQGRADRKLALGVGDAIGGFVASLEYGHTSRTRP